jgi:hypothetical protein
LLPIVKKDSKINRYHRGHKRFAGTPAHARCKS